MKDIKETLKCQKECHNSLPNVLKNDSHSIDEVSSFSFKIENNSEEELLSTDELTFLSTVCKAVDFEGKIK